MKFTTFLAGFFKDQSGKASQKRIIGYFLAYLLFIITKGSLEGKVVDTDVLFAVVGLLAFALGAITSEVFSKNITERNASSTTNPTNPNNT